MAKKRRGGRTRNNQKKGGEGGPGTTKKKGAEGGPGTTKKKGGEEGGQFRNNFCSYTGAAWYRCHTEFYQL